LWPGYKTSFVRVPDCDAAVICISNDATSDPHDLAFQVIDALIADRPGIHPVPPMPPVDRLAGRYLNPGTGATVDVAVDKSGHFTACTNGTAFTTIPTGDGGFVTSRGSADFTMWPASDDRLTVERDAGIRETLHRVEPGACLPTDLAGRYTNPDMAATWTIAATGQGAIVHVAGPLLTGTTWEIEAIEGDFIRIVTPSPLFRAWLDGRVLRGADGTITGLRVDGGRAKGLTFRREPA
jgi:hypothetical protein